LGRDVLSIDPTALLPFSHADLGKTRFLPCAVGGLWQLVLPGIPGRVINLWRLKKVSAIEEEFSLAELWFCLEKVTFFQAWHTFAKLCF